MLTVLELYLAHMNHCSPPVLQILAIYPWSDTELKHLTPINLPLRRTPEALRPEVRSQVEDMLKNGVIQESSSPYSAPVVIVQKEEWRSAFLY